MHFAYPARKSSDPPPFRPRSSKLPLLRRTRLRLVLVGVLAVIGVLYLLTGRKATDPYHEHIPSGSPPVVIVTIVDPTQYSTAYLKTIEQNRKDYAEKHGTCAPRRWAVWRSSQS